VAVNALCFCVWRAFSAVVLSGVVSTSHRFAAGPREMAYLLAPEASFLLDLVLLDAADVSLSEYHSVVDCPVRCFHGFEPNPQGYHVT
jgi:hypothetical protein